MTGRRRFLATATGAVAAAAACTKADAPKVIAQPKVQWRMSTTWTPALDVLQIPVPVLRDLRKLAAEVAREESEKTPMARKVHASFTKFQALVGPWDHVAEGAYHQLVAL